jgi:murein DD-endopeptidase MepM/ murein hydrolase activator NlpD
LTSNTARAIAYSAVALLAIAALRAAPPEIPETTPVAAVAAIAATPAAPRPVWVAYHDTLGRGESLVALLERRGVDGRAAIAALRETEAFDERRVPAGLALTLRAQSTDPEPSEVVLEFGVDRLVRLTRTASGWKGAEERLPWTTDTAVVAGSITSSLYAALDSAADGVLPSKLRSELAWSLADILEYRVDMSRDLQQGDSFRVLFERSSTPTGAVRVGRVLAVDMRLSGDTVQAFRYGRDDAAGTAHYYDRQGKSLRAAFLRAPLEFRRVSSVFGRRKHPIQGVWKTHKGTDYAAASGTPVRAIGDGSVVYVGARSGYGNVVEIRHANGYVTRYAHLRGFAKTARRGAHVGIGQTIGFVGMTGLATGPHLHFEVLVGGVQRDPRTALASKTGMPLSPGDQESFRRLRSQLLASLDGTSGPDSGQTRLAVAR